MRKIILEYHMVDEVYYDYNNINICPTYFEQHIRFLKENCHIVPYEDLVLGKGENGIQIAISFDDVFTGFKDIVYPIINQYKIPVILFLTEKYSALNQEFWMNELIRLLLEGKRYKREFLFNHPMYQYRFPTANFREREAAYNSLKFILGGLNESEREDCLEQIRDWVLAGYEIPKEYFPLSIDFCKAVKDNPLLSFGAHTVSHGILGEMAYAEQYKEIAHSKYYLEHELDRKIEHFAYPFGSYNNLTKKILEECNFKSACTSRRGWWEESKIDLFELPRMTPPNVGQEEFEKWIRMLCEEEKESKVDEFIAYIGKLEGDKEIHGRNAKCVIFGAGESGAILLNRMREMDLSIVGFADNDIQKQGKLFHGYPIFPADVLKNKEYEVYVWHYSRTILEQLEKMSVKNVHLITGV